MDPATQSYDYYNQSTYPTTAQAAGQDVTLDWDTLVMRPLEAMLAKVVSFIPDFIAAIYILVFGWIIAQLLKFVVGKFLAAVNFDNVAQKAGMSELLNEGAKKITPVQWTSNLVFWITMFVSIITALDKLRLYVASRRLDDLMFLFTSSITAVIILSSGMFLSMLVARIVQTTAKNLNVPKPNLYAGVIRWAILIFTLTLTLTQFKLPAQFIFIALGVVFAALCVTFVIAFGFGGRQWAAKVLDKLC